MSRIRSCASRDISACSCFSSVMFCPTPTTPTIESSGPRRVAAFSRMSTGFPALVYSGNSKLAVSSPPKAFCSTSCTESWNSGVMNLRTRSWPITSSLL